MSTVWLGLIGGLDDYIKVFRHRKEGLKGRFKIVENRVIGSGTVLDTARLKYAIGQHLNIDSRSVHAFIIGEHGDSEIAAWSSANISGVPLNTFCEMRGHYDHKSATEKIAEDVKNSAYEIISRKKATNYGIAMSVKRICEAIIRDEKSILPISSMMHRSSPRMRAWSISPFLWRTWSSR